MLIHRNHGETSGTEENSCRKEGGSPGQEGLAPTNRPRKSVIERASKNANAMTSTTLTNAFRQPRTTTTPVSEALAPVTPVSDTLVSSTPVSSAPISVQKRLQFGNSEDLKVLVKECVQEGKRLRFP